MLTQISVKMPDKPGILAEFTKILNENKIQIRSITVSQIPGLVLFLVNKPNDMISLLKKKNYEFSTETVLPVLLPDNPTSSELIQKVAQVLGENKININYLYSTFVEKGPMLILQVNDTNKAINALKSKKIYIYEKGDS